MSVALSESAPYQVCEPLTAAEYAELKKSIQSHGCLVAVEVDEFGDIIDGHHRVSVCEELGQTYERVVIEGLTAAEKVARAVEVNNVRRAPKWATREERDARIIELRREGLSTTLIAEELGVSDETVRSTSKNLEVDDQPAEVVGKDGKRRPAKQPDRSPAAVAARRDTVEAMRDAGATVAEMADAVGISNSAVHQILRKLGEPPAGTDLPYRSQQATAARYERVRELAAQGWTSAQIAADVGMAEASVKNGCRERGIEIPADAVLGKSRRHDSNRIVRETVDALEGLSLGIALANVEDLDPAEISDWTASLNNSLRSLNRFAKKMKEAVQ